MSNITTKIYHMLQSLTKVYNEYKLEITRDPES